MYSVLFKCMHVNIPVQKESISGIHAVPTAPARVEGTTWKPGNQVTGLDQIGDWHDHCIWNMVACRAAKIEYVNVVIKCTKWLEQVHIDERVWIKTEVGW